MVVGADRVAANGDVANKIGTYGLALASHRAGIPFLVAAPESTLDEATPTGAAIPIELRADAEVAVPAAPADPGAQLRVRHHPGRTRHGGGHGGAADHPGRSKPNWSFRSVNPQAR